MKPACLIRGLAAPLVIAALLAGCGSMPPLKQVMLSPPQTQRLPAQPSSWQVHRVQMPEYLDSYDIQLRSGDYVLSQMPNAKWAERLPAATTRLLRQTIDEKLQHHRDKRYDVHVDIATFEPQPGGQVVLAAEWRVTNPGGDVIAHDDALIKKPLSQTDALGDDASAGAIGAAMSAAVRELAMQIVARAG